MRSRLGDIRGSLVSPHIAALMRATACASPQDVIIEADRTQQMESCASLLFAQM
jgi:hypothetical protein